MQFTKAFREGIYQIQRNSMCFFNLVPFRFLSINKYTFQHSFIIEDWFASLHYCEEKKDTSPHIALQWLLRHFREKHVVHESVLCSPTVHKQSSRALCDHLNLTIHKAATDFPREDTRCIPGVCAVDMLSTLCPNVHIWTTAWRVAPSRAMRGWCLKIM